MSYIGRGLVKDTLVRTTEGIFNCEELKYYDRLVDEYTGKAVKVTITRSTCLGCIKFFLDNRFKISCGPDTEFFNKESSIFAKDLEQGQEIKTCEGFSKIIDIKKYPVMLSVVVLQTCPCIFAAGGILIKGTDKKQWEN